MSTKQRRERVLALDEAERKARGLFVACRSFGDTRGQHEARRELAGIVRARKALQRRAGTVLATA